MGGTRRILILGTIYTAPNSLQPLLCPLKSSMLLGPKSSLGAASLCAEFVVGKVFLGVGSSFGTPRPMSLRSTLSSMLQSSLLKGF